MAEEEIIDIDGEDFKIENTQNLKRSCEELDDETEIKKIKKCNEESENSVKHDKTESKDVPKEIEKKSKSELIQYLNSESWKKIIGNEFEKSYFQFLVCKF
jgi:hypothetical protein